MKKLQIFTLILFFIALTGCNIKGEYDIKGTVIEVDKAGSILVEDEKLGLIWLSLPETTDLTILKKGQKVAVWTDGKIRESYPLQGTALDIEVIK
jgi:hypothetical protein